MTDEDGYLADVVLVGDEVEAEEARVRVVEVEGRGGERLRGERQQSLAQLAARRVLDSLRTGAEQVARQCGHVRLLA